MTTLSCQEFVISAIYYSWVNDNNYNMMTYIIGGPVIGWVISIFVTYLLGYFLQNIYNAQSAYADEFRRNKDPKFRD